MACYQYWKWILGLSVVLLIPSAGYGEITISPKSVFAGAAKRMVPVYISNPGEAESEVWAEIKYGYVRSDDSGRANIFIDSASTDETSAEAWVKAYPQHFILPPGKVQTIRIVSYPPPNLRDGEYWARIVVYAKPRNPLKKVTKDFTPRKSRVGLVQALSIPYYYRQGKVTTGLESSSLNVTSSPKEAVCTFTLTRIGNAAFNGMMTIRLVNSQGKLVSSKSEVQVVFKSYFVREVLDRTTISPGKYTLEVEIEGGKRRDIDKKELLNTPPLRLSSPVELK